MLFPSISVYLSLHEDPTSLGLDVFPLKLHGEFFQFTPSMLCPRFSKWLCSFHLSFVSKKCFIFSSLVYSSTLWERTKGCAFCSVSVCGFAVWLLCSFVIAKFICVKMLPVGKYYTKRSTMRGTLVSYNILFVISMSLDISLAFKLVSVIEFMGERKEFLL